MRRDATRPQAAGPARTGRILTRVRTHRRDTGRESTRSSTRGAGGAVPGGRSVEREPGTRAPGVDPGDARAKRAPAARGSSGLGTLHGRPGCTLPRALASRVTRVRTCTWCLPPPARRDPRPLNRFERKRRDARRRPRRRGPERPRGGARNGAASSVRRTRAGRARRAAPRVRPRVALKNSCGCRRRGPGAGAAWCAPRARPWAWS